MKTGSLVVAPKSCPGRCGFAQSLSDQVAFAFPHDFRGSQTVSKSIYVPKWVCAGAILLSAAVLITQAVIDVRQATMGMPLFSDQWFAQAWQIGLVTPSIILTANAWRTYYSARTPAERERILGQIQVD